MNSSRLHFFTSRACLVLALAAGSVAPALVQAQQVYRIVGPDGRVTFSDTAPPASAGNAKASQAGSGAAGSVPSSGLPFELRQVSAKYPVVLYTGDNCGPCGAGRSLLTSRGIPFSEKTVTTVQDSAALQRMSGESSLPFLTIGSQQLKGFSDAEWTQYLNAAGYPASSALPSGYRPPAPSPLVAQTQAPAPAEASPSTDVRITPATRPTRPPATGNDNPSGIRF